MIAGAGLQAVAEQWSAISRRITTYHLHQRRATSCTYTRDRTRVPMITGVTGHARSPARLTNHPLCARRRDEIAERGARRGGCDVEQRRRHLATALWTRLNALAVVARSLAVQHSEEREGYDLGAVNLNLRCGVDEGGLDARLKPAWACVVAQARKGSVRPRARRDLVEICARRDA